MEVQAPIDVDGLAGDERRVVGAEEHQRTFEIKLARSGFTWKRPPRTWIAALAILVLLERLLRRPAWFARAAGATLFAWGALLAVQAGTLP